MEGFLEEVMFKTCRMKRDWPFSLIEGGALYSNCGTQSHVCLNYLLIT